MKSMTSTIASIFAVFVVLMVIGFLFQWNFAAFWNWATSWISVAFDWTVGFFEGIFSQVSMGTPATIENHL